jgi:organic radical activating enzyme
MIKINEIFYSIQGEVDIGVPSIFIRVKVVI